MSVVSSVCLSRVGYGTLFVVKPNVTKRPTNFSIWNFSVSITTRDYFLKLSPRNVKFHVHCLCYEQGPKYL